MLGLGLGIGDAAVLRPSGVSTAVGALALFRWETDGLAADFTYSDAAKRVAKKVAGVPTEYAVDDVFFNSGTTPKMVYDVDGLLRWTPHNMLLQSEDLTTSWPVASATVSANTEGVADDVVVAVQGASRGVSQAVTVANGMVYTFGIDVKYVDTPWVRLKGDTSSAGGEVWFNVQTGVKGTESTATGTIAALGDGFYRCTISWAQQDTSAAVAMFGANADASATTPVGSVRYKRAQMNRGYLPTTYFATTTAIRVGLAVDYDPVTHECLGLLVEAGATNLALRGRDFANASWVKSNLTAARTATGPDGIATVASTLTATAANATALQAITSASASRVTSVFLKRRTGTGPIDLTQDNGTTWVTADVTSAWKRFALPAVTSANPTVGIRVVTSGDAVDADLFQHEAVSVVTSPVPTFVSAQSKTGDWPRVLSLATIPALGSAYSIYIKAQEPLIGSNYFLALTDGTTTEVVGLRDLTSKANLNVVDGNVSQASASSVADIVVDADQQMTAGIELNNFAVSLNGAAAVIDTAGTVPTTTMMDLGTILGAASRTRRIKKLFLKPGRVANGDLPTWRYAA